MNNQKTTVALLSTAMIVSLLSGCTKATSPDAKKDATATTSATDAGKTADASKPADASSTADASKPADGSKPTSLNGPISISLNDLPDDLVICTVAGSPIKVADYRNMLKIQQAQIELQIANDPITRANFLQAAKQQNASLTADERSKLIETAKAKQGANFQSFLKEKNLTETQWEEEVANAGLEFKVANAALEKNLLPQLVSREIMAKAATDSGKTKDAMNSFATIEKSKDYEVIKSQTGLSPASLKDELVKGELAKMQIQNLAKTIKVSDSEIKSFYNAHKNELKHGERIHLASILLVAPGEDVGPIKSVRTQLHDANPKLTGKDLETATANFITQQQNQALILLGEAKAPGADFSRLANEHTQDVNARSKKNGGDMGWQEKTQLVPTFANAVWGLKPGTVLPQLVKTAEGYRVIKVTGHEQAGPLPLADVHNLIANKLKQDKLNATVQQWVAQQQQKTKIEFSQRFVALATDKGKTATH